MMKSLHALLVAIAVCASCGPSGGGVKAAVWRASSPADIRALLPKVAAGDVIDLGTSHMGALALGRGSPGSPGVERLKGVRIRGGVFSSIRLNNADGLSMENFKVQLEAKGRAIHLTAPSRVSFRNFDLQGVPLPPDQPRQGTGIFMDGRGGGDGGVVIENGNLSDLSTGIGFGWMKDVTIRSVTVYNISTDGLLLGNSSNILVENYTCGPFFKSARGAHPDCLQADQASGPINGLTIRGFTMASGSQPNQGIFAGTPFGNKFRHSNWSISNVRMLGNYYRGISVGGIDGLAISDTILLSPEKDSVHFSMLTVGNSSNVTMRDNVACSHSRTNLSNLVETGQVTIPCKSSRNAGGMPRDKRAFKAMLQDVRSELSVIEAMPDATGVGAAAKRMARGSFSATAK